MDIDPNVIATINSGGIHIIEPDLDAIVHQAVNKGKLRATLIPENADAFLISVPTPIHKDNMAPNLDYIQAAANSIAPVISRGNLIILESTVPVGTTEKLALAIVEETRFNTNTLDASDIHIAHCPERVLPGKVMNELIQNDKLVECPRTPDSRSCILHLCKANALLRLLHGPPNF